MIARIPSDSLVRKVTASVSARLSHAKYPSRLWAAFAWVAFCTTASGPALADDSLYQALGEKEGITKIVEHALVHHLSNRQIKAQFDDISLDHLKGQLVIFICQVTGGPCVYTGHNMSIVHKGMHLTDADFDAVVEDMQLAMDEVEIPYRTQNRLLARLSPYERDVVTK